MYKGQGDHVTNNPSDWLTDILTSLSPVCESTLKSGQKLIEATKAVTGAKEKDLHVVDLTKEEEK